ncbi:release factor H-coupled R [Rickenella mellea]|uniref:3'-phosphate/5'-hydroxy nucleic acid ligase n=1 Tax=Rickenella mellea TaxID=50990 RepID=A0A4Y7Q1N7_9AGAM|nr:release factor H-coupled R [Rickenella mellea]
MPGRPLTISLNANQSKKFVCLLPDDTTNCKAFILKEARNKFRIKGLSHVFVQGGAELHDEEAIRYDNSSFFVSKGEAYVGRTAAPSNTNQRGEIRIIADKSFIDDKAISQLKAVASLPGVHLACGMPDLHPGDRFPVGCVIVADGVYPALIGSDIGCGIGLYELSSLSRSAANPSKLAGLLRGLDEPWDGSASQWLSHYGLPSRPELETSLGSVGLGNHFAEICTVERIVDEGLAQKSRIKSSAMYLLVHTGSRGLGSSILANVTRAESNPYFSEQSSSFNSYLDEHDYAIKWAVSNRDLVARRIQHCLFAPGTTDSELDKLDKILDVTHNSVSRSVLLIGGEKKDVWIHRKGAAPADRGATPCPGSRGDFSWLLEPVGDGHENAHSLAHGAGRRHPRQVLHTIANKYTKSSLTTTTLGSEVVCTDSDLLVEEMPEAYKSIQCVVDDMTDKGICRGIAVLRPVVSYKVREGGQRNKK